MNHADIICSRTHSHFQWLSGSGQLVKRWSDISGHHNKIIPSAQLVSNLVQPYSTESWLKRPDIALLASSTREMFYYIVSDITALAHEIILVLRIVLRFTLKMLLFWLRVSLAFAIECCWCICDIPVLMSSYNCMENRILLFHNVIT